MVSPAVAGTSVVGEPPPAAGTEKTDEWSVVTTLLLSGDHDRGSPRAENGTGPYTGWRPPPSVFTITSVYFVVGVVSRSQHASCAPFGAHAGASQLANATWGAPPTVSCMYSG